MGNWLKKYMWFIVIAVLLLLLPLLINLCYLWESSYNVLHSPSAWTTFWATYLAAIGSFLMIYFTWKTLKEMQRQWNETNRARLTFAIVVYNGLYLLKVTNCGTATAYNISIKFNKDFIDNHFSNRIKETLKELGEKPFCIEAGASKHYHLSPIKDSGPWRIGKETFTSEQINKWLDEYLSNKISITGRYCDIYEIKDNFSIEDFINDAIAVKDELHLDVERIMKGMIVQNNSYYPIQKSLDIIAKNIIQINTEFKNKDNTPSGIN